MLNQRRPCVNSNWPEETLLVHDRIERGNFDVKRAPGWKINQRVDSRDSIGVSDFILPGFTIPDLGSNEVVREQVSFEALIEFAPRILLL